MRPLFVVVGNELVNQASQVLLAKNDEVIEALLLNGLHESLHVSVLIKCPNRSSFQLHAV